ncbi:MAG TPA: ATP-binding protein [Bacillota bacterium]|nr:ATP-binding protein [Bacillota bacterium]
MLQELPNQCPYYLLSWSGGKDSAWALKTALEEYTLPIVLLTTVNEDYNRIAMHGVRQELLKAQAEALALPLVTVGIPKQCSDEEYGLRMKAAMLEQRSRGCQGIIFGDLFLTDIRTYREKKLEPLGLPAFFPIWGSDTEKLSRRFIAEGFKSIITCTDSQALDASFSGRIYDQTFLTDLPSSVDPCGENGEFHSFTFDGPIFRWPVKFKKGETLRRDGRFDYTELYEESSSNSIR